MSQARKPKQAATIMALMKSLGRPTAFTGVCRGLALMAERARRCGEYDKFVSRMDFLGQIKENEISTLKQIIQIAEQYRNKIVKELEEKINAIKLNVHSKTKEEIDDEIEKTIENAIMANANEEGFIPITSTLTFEDAEEPILLTPSDLLQLLTIKPFFEQIWAHFNPDAIKEFLEITGPSLHQRLDAHKIEQLIYDPDSRDLRISPLLKPTLYPLFQNNKSGSEDGYLKLFLDAVEKASSLATNHYDSVGLVLSFHDHAIHLFYDKNNWQITNHSELITRKTTSEVIDVIKLIEQSIRAKELEMKSNESGFNPLPMEQYNNPVPNLIFQLYSDNPPAALKDELDELVQASLTTACQAENFNKRDSSDASVLETAVQAGRDDLLQTLLTTNPKSEIDVNNLNVALTRAVQVGRVELVETLLKADANPHAWKDLIGIAAKNNSMDIVAALVKANAPGVEALLSEAQQKGNFELVKTLLKAGIKGGETLLYKAAEKGDLKLVQAILEAGIDPNIYFIDKTPLFIAAQKGFSECVALLLQHGADAKKPCAMKQNQLQQYGMIYRVIAQVDEYIKNNNNNPTLNVTPYDIAHIFGKENVEKIFLEHNQKKQAADEAVHAEVKQLSSLRDSGKHPFFQAVNQAVNDSPFKALIVENKLEQQNKSQQSDPFEEQSTGKKNKS